MYGTEKIDQKFKAKWVEALLSGKYKQGSGYLRTYDDKYCCLGVACDLLQVEWLNRGPDYQTYVLEDKMRGDLRSGIIPEHLRLQIKLGHEEQSRLIGLNDEMKLDPETQEVTKLNAHDFTRIAKWIEENL